VRDGELYAVRTDERARRSLVPFWVLRPVPPQLFPGRPDHMPVPGIWVGRQGELKNREYIIELSRSIKAV
jgi:hypothetical protein